MNETQKISPEDKALLLESIEAAQGYGSCSYSVNRSGNEPCCVVAQFAVRKGIDVKELREGYPAHNQLQSVQARMTVPGLHLRHLQRVWDMGMRRGLTEDDARAEMRRIVEEYSA